MEEQNLAIERFEKALKYVDKLLPLLPDFSHFNISSIVLTSGWTQQEIDEAYNLDSVIQTLLISRLKYVDGSAEAYWIELNDIGRQVKNAGGHFAFLTCLADKAAVDKERQERKDKSDKLDLVMKEWQVRTKRLPYILSALALVGTIISILIAFKALNKKQDQKDLRPVQQQIQVLQDRVKLLDSLHQSDTLLKKRSE